MNEHRQLNIKDAEAYDLAKEIAEIRGLSLTAAVLKALRAEAAYARKQRDAPARIAKLLEYGKWYSALPDKDTRTPEEILGYDENGLPT
jgi:antitoxin VapB